MAKKAEGSSGLSKPVAVYQLKVNLDGIRPPIWRRVQVRGDISLFKLHKIRKCKGEEFNCIKDTPGYVWERCPRTCIGSWTLQELYSF